MENWILVLLLCLSTTSGVPVKGRGISGCPDPASIYPCQCTPNPSDYENGKPGLYCSGIVSPEQAEPIFSSSSKAGGYSYIILSDLLVGELTKDFFAQTTSDVLTIRNSNLTRIDPEAFRYFDSVLTILSVQNCQNLESFPFASLAGFNLLAMLELANVGLTSVDNFPELPSLNQLVIETPGTLTSIALLPSLPKLTRVAFKGKRLDIPPFAFYGLPMLDMLDLSSNDIYRLRTNALAFSTPSIRAIMLQESPLDYLEVNAIQGIDPNTTIDVSGNVRYLHEVSWKPILETMAKGTGTVTANSHVQQEGLICDCHLAWLIRNPDLLAHVRSAICSRDGSKFGGLPLSDIPSDGMDHCV